MNLSSIFPVATQTQNYTESMEEITQMILDARSEGRKFISFRDLPKDMKNKLHKNFNRKNGYNVVSQVHFVSKVDFSGYWNSMVEIIY